MNAHEIEQRLKAAITDAEHIAVEGDGGKFTVTVVHTAFETLRPVAKQQLIYGPLQADIASGAIHAVSMRTFTPEEWRKAKLFG
ncbi:acid stress-induced BolA-like protein IbaG/YrbA [Paraperlucidibaca baekdonensis]|uniref:Acid stress-induced BolA-like protein IbaG/YrbA n=1 Tax=Paraperlucidibaca baekdonensis TaxID=748120 RepID=A0A3E0H5A4_9GAMM|nr:BolA/IbaG family iron-sulfur metabolism protein [Paraperlucidibaca baekdonensis]REH38729.1 acid stress-induced BolA-like protein IbaG/YrbA [Paraperlucidibaca baekdonensis]